MKKLKEQTRAISMAKLDEVKEESYYSESYGQQDEMPGESKIPLINNTMINHTKPKKVL